MKGMTAVAVMRYLVVTLAVLLGLSGIDQVLDWHSCLAEELLDPLTPSGDIQARIPTYTWNCQSAATYRIQLRTASSGVELASDWKPVQPKNGICTYPINANDQLRLRAGTLPIMKQFQWVVRATTNSDWSLAKPFTIVPVISAGFPPNPDWVSIGPGWHTDDSSSLANGSITNNDAEYYIFHGQLSNEENQNLIQRAKIYVKLAISCGSEISCVSSIMLNSDLSLECITNDPKCKAPSSGVSISIDNHKKYSLIRRIGFDDQVIYTGNSDLIDGDGGENLIHIITTYGMPPNRFLRLYINGSQVYCGPHPVNYSPISRGVVGVGWKSTGVPLGGSGLTVNELVMAEGPDMQKVPFNVWCAIPLPSRDD
jgi:hypothetical protein